MASCLQYGHPADLKAPDKYSEGNEIVRRHAILLLSRLILKDYIKWRGLLFHRFIAALVDDDDSVAKLAMITLTGPLLSKQPNIFYNNFVEATFVLNGCKSHPIYVAATSVNSFSDNPIEFDDLKFYGTKGKEKRREIYRILLSRMSDEEKIGITARLAKEVLSALIESSVENSIDYGKSPSKLSLLGNKNRNRVEQVLSDTFHILSSPELCIGKSTTKYGEDEDDTESSSQKVGPSAAQISAVKGKLLSKISRKHLIEIVVPILSNLKLMLEKICSPLLKDLMKYFVQIYQQFRGEVVEVLVSDVTLLKELEYDSRNVEKKLNSEINTDKNSDAFN
eukprot:CAMPEP_0184859012 /NCGR_PEP_ID=MMETSP0580-20130426/4035_1 /TAXON_ID=1118495 /ORGANISM="Dactyliosolen fragilissimus" /LENGTH=336 /DNA_ID=CAMNT_0027355415 /DNA_START=1239 /DNA_END=2246 /DNA_ORIENTATION=+